MTPIQVETAIPFPNNRAVPLSQIAPFVSGVGATGLVDTFWVWDELSSWFPKSLWTLENAGWAEALPLDSTYDPFLECAFALAANPGLGVRMSTDAIRARPAELMRTLMTLSGASSGRTVLALGAGELRQTKPFGYRRKEGLGRFEDVLRLMQLLWERDEPFDFEGNFWSFKSAYLGAARPERRPEIWALGGGPKLIELAAKYADGFETNSPVSAVTPEKWATTVNDIKEKVQANGRDPEQFGFGVWFGTFMHEDRDVIEQAFDNPLLKYFAPIFGRSSQAMWAEEGFEPVMPDDYHYAMHFSPFDMTAADAQAVVDKVPREMVEKALHVGSPAECAARAREFVEAGATFIGLVDVLPLVLGPEDAEGAMGRALEFMGHLRGG